MAQTQLAAASRMQKWISDFIFEYVRDSAFMPYMGDATGNGAMMPIVVRSELTAGGKTVNIPLIERLEGAGVRGTRTLEGNEEALGNYNHPITVNWNRHAVAVPKPEEHWTEIDLMNAGKLALKTWAAEGLRDDVITGLMAYTGSAFLRGVDADDTATPARTPLQAYNAVSEAVKDAWLAANSDRYLFGAARANNAADDHSAALGEIDTTNDRMTTNMVTLAKNIAREADRKIRPVKQSVSMGRDDYVLFVGSRGFRDLKADTAMQNANRDARVRGVENNPIFQDGDLIWDGVVIREIPEIPVISGVGNSGSDVSEAFLCGAQALGLAWGQKPRPVKSNNTDYGFVEKPGIEECRGVSKLAFQGVQHGLVNVFHSAPAAV